MNEKYTTILIRKDDLQRLKRQRLVPREPYYSVVNRLIDYKKGDDNAKTTVNKTVEPVLL